MAPNNNRPCGIPTMYAGIQFRSRLEAKWAAFFDICGWKWQYEPFDLPGWIPDFLLNGDSITLVEVKPLAKHDATQWLSVMEKCEKAILNRDQIIDVDSVLFLGTQPHVIEDGYVAVGFFGNVPRVNCGCEFFGDKECNCLEAYKHKQIYVTDGIVGVYDDICNNDYCLDFCHKEQSYTGCMFGGHDGHLPRDVFGDVLKNWASASNLVQWNRTA